MLHSGGVSGDWVSLDRQLDNINQSLPNQAQWEVDKMYPLQDIAEVNSSLNLLNWSPVLLLQGQDVEAACRGAVAVPPLDVGQDLLQVGLDPHDPLQLRRHLALLLFSQYRVVLLRVGVQRQPGALGRLLIWTI